MAAEIVVALKVLDTGDHLVLAADDGGPCYRDMLRLYALMDVAVVEIVAAPGLFPAEAAFAVEAICGPVDGNNRATRCVIALGGRPDKPVILATLLEDVRAAVVFSHVPAHWRKRRQASAGCAAGRSSLLQGDDVRPSFPHRPCDPDSAAAVAAAAVVTTEEKPTRVVVYSSVAKTSIVLPADDEAGLVCHPTVVSRRHPEFRAEVVPSGIVVSAPTLLEDLFHDRYFEDAGSFGARISSYRALCHAFSNAFCHALCQSNENASRHDHDDRERVAQFFDWYYSFVEEEDEDDDRGQTVRVDELLTELRAHLGGGGGGGGGGRRGPAAIDAGRLERLVPKLRRRRIGDAYHYCGLRRNPTVRGVSLDAIEEKRDREYKAMMAAK